MTIQELISKLNEYCKNNNIFDLDCIDGEMAEELEKLKFEYVTSVARDEHRWYVLCNSVYKVSIDDQTYYIGTWEVETIKSECMSVSDCGSILKFFEMEQYSTVSYRRKR